MKLTTYYFTLSGMILFNLMFGPLVRATDSGLACPDWPLCYGKFVPEWTFHIFMEVGHRYYSGAIGILVFWGLFRVYKSEGKGLLFRIAILSSVLLVSQVILGALTVTKLLHPTTVNLHLLNAILLLLTCGTIALLAKKDTAAWNWPPQAWQIFVLLLVGIFYQIFLGGKVSSNYAGLACPDFPTCYGEWIPPMEGNIVYQMEHRYFGYLLALLVFGTTSYAIFYLKAEKVKFYLKLASYLIVLQILLGAFNVIYHLPKLLTGIHTLNAVLTLLACYTATFYHFRKVS
ncbi:cytochrome oxidase assembly protein [Leptospira ryugenii]|uniref:Cytochrome oxidase assembly protein n=1 Tax=Leptospira ryugenii TaxID=1917863 RepID=A0A2P2E1N2_9LEPT|nr:COX15/CtaA family protein [Leptospira ryugenii]GBF50795.1 cytochrome oxidase assembly protein [Leptospira ryugenii]